MKTKYFALLFLFAAGLINSIYPQTKEHHSSVLAKAIINRIINETVFELKEIDQKPSMFIQVIDFSLSKLKSKSKGIIAESILNIPKDAQLSFGICNNNPIKIFIDNNLLFESNKSRKFIFREIAYEILKFQDTVNIRLPKGKHTIAIHSTAKPAKVYLREITEPETATISEFISNHPEKISTWPWCYRTLSNEDKESHNKCTVVPPIKIKQIKIPSNVTYKRESYAEWQYPNGSLMMSILDIAKTSGVSDYKKFVERSANFTLDNYQNLKRQYFEQNDFRGSNHKLFRRCMLDDSGSPALHLLELAVIDKTKKYDWLINELDAYISKKQVRLPDGTFCRYEPSKFTVWADDLFMSVPFLLRMGAITKKSSYYDDVARQILNMNKYLLDSEKGIYHHAWYDFKKEQSPILWGRANGWIIWAEAEAIKYLPKTHKYYEKIKNIYREHLIALTKYQGVNGLWHQVLDDNTSYEETSCTAMFTIGLIRAIDMGILDSSYSSYIDKAWEGLASKISEDGIVKDICRGTGISDDINFYKARERFPNDPRGLGSVLTALNEITKFYSK